MIFELARQVAESTTELSTLVSLVLLAELKDQLSANGPFTVFAPTDAAFAALGQETLEVETLVSRCGSGRCRLPCFWGEGGTCNVGCRRLLCFWGEELLGYIL